MSKLAIVYWSGTGNTESMAAMVAAGAKEAGAQVDLFTAAEFGPQQMDQYDAIAFGCPSMGAEQLEEGEFEPMFSACEAKLAGKKLGLFGSYGWGDGEWMRTWAADCEDAGCSLVGEPVIACGAPEGDAADACRELGKDLAAV